MTEHLEISTGEKEEVYSTFLKQVVALVGDETDQTANLGNVSAALKQTFNHLWVGFYIIKEDELVLGPFQGPIACTRIQKGRGVCGKSWEDAITFVVDDVDAFPGHIACSSSSKSEIVVPLIRAGSVIGVLDIDSSELATFDDIDRKYLNLLCEWLVTVI